MGAGWLMTTRGEASCGPAGQEPESPCSHRPYGGSLMSSGDSSSESVRAAGQPVSEERAQKDELLEAGWAVSSG